MRFVLDCSVAISWCMPDETNNEAEVILNLLSRDSEAVVPSIWWLEIINVLLVAERRKRITRDIAAEALTKLRALRIVVDTNTSQSSLDATLELSRQYNLAAYLELAIREKLLLASIDNRLAEAAKHYIVLLQNPTIET